MSSDNKQKKDLFVKGLTWGTYSLSENEMDFKGESKDWFKIPFNSLSNVQQGINKNEITLEFNKDEDNNNDSAICELRLFVPDQDLNKDKQKDKKKQKEENQNEENEKKEENEEKEEEEKNKVKKTRGELLKEEIIKLAGISSISGAIAHIPETQTVIPRGKFAIFFLKTCLKIHGQTHNYKTEIKNIVKVFLVPKVEGNFSYLILKLRSPLSQGNTSYPFVIFQIKAENELKVNLQIPEDDEDCQKMVEELPNPLEGRTVDVIAQLFKTIVHKNLIIPSESFSFNKGPFIKCSYKANDGVLYFLEKSFLFVHKPVLDIEHESIKEIDLARIHESGMQQRSFDMTIKLKSKKESYQFSGLDREEMDKLQEYIKAKKIKLNSVDENNNNVEMPNYPTRRRAPVDEEIPDLPSEKELGDEDYVDSGEGSEEDEDEEEEIEEEEKKKKKKKEKKKKKKEEEDHE